MTNYFNQLSLRDQLEQLGQCRFMNSNEFESGVSKLTGKKIVIVGCGAQGLNQGLNILISVIITPILFQNLGSCQFGLVNLSFSIFILISIVVSYGYHLNAPKNISLLNNIKLERNLISEIISLRFFILSTIIDP